MHIMCVWAPQTREARAGREGEKLSLDTGGVALGAARRDGQTAVLNVLRARIPEAARAETRVVINSNKTDNIAGWSGRGR